MGLILRCASDARIKIVLVCICFEFTVCIIYSSRNTPSPLNSHIISYSIFVYKTNIISVIMCRNSNSGLFLRYSFANRSIHNANGTGSGHVELTATNGKRVKFLYTCDGYNSSCVGIRIGIESLATINIDDNVEI